MFENYFKKRYNNAIEDEKSISENEYDDVEDEYSNTARDAHCYECSGYGDDYSINDAGEMVWNCPKCPFGSYDEN
jgi:hypothetical protein